MSGGRSTQPLRPRGPQERSGAGKPDSPAAGSRNTESPARPQHFFSRNERRRLRFQSASHDQLSSAQLSTAPYPRAATGRGHGPAEPPALRFSTDRARGAERNRTLPAPSRRRGGPRRNVPGAEPRPRHSLAATTMARTLLSMSSSPGCAITGPLRSAPQPAGPGRAQHSAGSGTAPPGPLAAGPEVAVATRRAGGAPGRSGREGRDRRPRAGAPRGHREGEPVINGQRRPPPAGRSGAAPAERSPGGQPQPAQSRHTAP